MPILKYYDPKLKILLQIQYECVIGLSNRIFDLEELGVDTTIIDDDNNVMSGQEFVMEMFLESLF